MPLSPIPAEKNWSLPLNKVWDSNPPLKKGSWEKIQVTGIWGAQACPGKGQIHAAETDAGFSAAGVARRKWGKGFAVIRLPPVLAA